jgi:peptide/nickel transport system permease protein
VLLQQLRERFGLDRPVLEQLSIYLKGYLTFDLGFSYRQNRPVLDLIGERLPATLLLTGAAFVVSLGLGTLLGALAARRVGRWSDSAITTLALVFYATPLFWIALMGQIVFALKLDWLPNVGYETIGANYTGLARAGDIARHLVLPALTLGLFFTALYARMMRASMLEVAGSDFVKTARAKGLAEGTVMRRHVARNAILPVVTLAGLQAGQLVGGAVLTETVFAWPGIGRLMFDALAQRDYQVLLGVFFVSSAMVVGFNLVTDLVYRWADPRIGAAA